MDDISDAIAYFSPARSIFLGTSRWIRSRIKAVLGLFGF
jgi:hypothetical protein